VMAIELVYAGLTITLPDEDANATITTITEAAASGEHRWLEVMSADGPLHILIGPGIPVAVRESETKWARRHW
jgi:hypothetical protein